MATSRTPKFSREFQIIDEMAKEETDPTHPYFNTLRASDAAKLFLVTFGRDRAQGKVASFLAEDAQVGSIERRFLELVATMLDAAIDHADDELESGELLAARVGE